MNVNQLIIEAGSAIGYPVAQDIYTGSKEKYITFTYEDERAALYADDEEQIETAYLMVSMVTPTDYNYFSDSAKLKKKLKKSGFNVPSIQSWIENEGTKKIRRTIFTVNITGQED